MLIVVIGLISVISGIILGCNQADGNSVASCKANVHTAQKHGTDAKYYAGYEDGVKFSKEKVEQMQEPCNREALLEE